MKKVLLFIFLICLVFFFTLDVDAEYYVNNVFRISLNGEQNINYDEQINVDIDVRVTYNLSAIFSNLNYDTDKLQLIDCKSDDFVCTFDNKKVLLDSVVGIEGEKTVAKLTFKVLDGFKPGDDTVISLNDVEGSDNTAGNKFDFKIHKLKNDTSLTSLSVENEKLIPEFSSSNTIYKVNTINSSINIKATSNSSVSNLGLKKLNYGNNIFEIIVRAENGEEKKYYINIFRKNKIIDNDSNNKNSSENNNNISSKSSNDSKKSNNNSKISKSGSNNDSSSNSGKLSSNKKLKFLKIEGIDFEFNNDILEYNINIDYDVKKLNIDYELEDNKSKVVISGDTTFVKENNLMIISVIAEDGSQVDYKIHIRKNDKNSTVEIVDDSVKETNGMKKESKRINYGMIIIIVLGILGVFIFAFLKKRNSN